MQRLWAAQHRLWQGLARWRASGTEPGPRALLAEVQHLHWFVPLFHHWLALESRVGGHGVRMTALGWLDFRSAWLKPELATGPPGRRPTAPHRQGRLSLDQERVSLSPVQ